ncbi:MAG: glutamyl-tRNA reductase, partial [Bacteroidota bacterium]
PLPEVQLSAYFEVINEHREAVRHLFRVACGLESQVVGDLQISNQVKKSYQMAADFNTAGPFLHRLLHTIFFTNKKIVQETPFQSGAASTSYAAVEMLEMFAKDMAHPKVLVLGIGEIGADVCRNLSDSFIEDVCIINRTRSKAEALAKECQARIGDYAHIEEEIAQADMIVCSVARNEPFIHPAMLKNSNPYAYKYFIDLAVPRSIDPSIEEIPGHILYNIDQINNKANEALQRRLDCIPQVEEIVVEAIAEFNDWSREMEVSPTIQKLKGALEQIRKEEIDRFTKKMNSQDMVLVDAVTKSMMQKIIKLPALQLKAACRRGEADTLIDVLNDLFNLERLPVKD